MVRLVSLQKRPDKHLMYHVQQETEGKDVASQIIPKPEASRNLTRTLQQKPPCKPFRVWHTRANMTGRGQEATAHTCGAESTNWCYIAGGRNQAERPVLQAHCEARSPSRPCDSSRTTAGQKLLSCGLACEQTETAEKEPARPPPFFDCRSHESLGQKFPACSMHAQAGVRRRFCILNRV